MKVDILRDLKLVEEIGSAIADDGKKKILCIDGGKNPVLGEIAATFPNEIVACGTTPNIYINDLHQRIRFVYDKYQGRHFPDKHFGVIFIRKYISKAKQLKFLIRNNLHALEPGGLFLFRMNGSPKNIEKLWTLMSENIDGSYKISRPSINESWIKVVASKDSLSEKRLPSGVSILLLFSGTGGVSEYTNVLKKRLQEEYELSVQICYSVIDIKYRIVIIEYAPALIESTILMTQIRFLIKKGIKVILDVHDWLPIRGKDRRYLERNCILTFKSYDISQLFGKTNRFYLFPHLSYNFQIPPKRRDLTGETKPIACTFGYASKGKRLLNIIEMARLSKIDLKILIGTSTEWSGGDRSFDEVIKLLKTSGIDYSKDDINSSKSIDSNFIVKTSSYSTEGLIKELSNCDLFVFAHANNYQPSGSLIFAREFSVPVVCTDSVKARLSQVNIVTSLIKSQSMTDAISYLKVPLLFHLFHPGNLIEDLKQILYHIFNSIRILRGNEVFSLGKINFRESRLEGKVDDGLDYLRSILSGIHE